MRILSLNIHISHIFDSDAFLSAEDNGRAAILTIEGLVHIEQKDILKLQPLTLMDSHQLDCIFRSSQRDTSQIVLIFQNSVNHADKAGQTFETRLFIVVGPQGQGIEIGLTLLTVWQSPHHIVVKTILINLPD